MNSTEPQTFMKLLIWVRQEAKLWTSQTLHSSDSQKHAHKYINKTVLGHYQRYYKQNELINSGWKGIFIVCLGEASWTVIIRLKINGKEKQPVKDLGKKIWGRETTEGKTLKQERAGCVSETKSRWQGFSEWGRGLCVMRFWADHVRLYNWLEMILDVIPSVMINHQKFFRRVVWSNVVYIRSQW